MKVFHFFALIIIFLISNVEAEVNKLPDDFVYLTDIDPTIIESIRYNTDQNFLGRVVTGYEKATRIVCTREAAQRLQKANEAFKEEGYKIVVYDGYRPQRAVNEFGKWSLDAKDNATKQYYYPNLDKKDLVKLGYIIAGKKSSHSRGSTFDLTLIEIGKNLKPITISKRPLKDGEEIPFLDDNTVDMGSSFDLFHAVSHPDSLPEKLIQPDQISMRKLLHDIMTYNGFKVHQNEWWHFTLENEPFPNTYFDFVVETN